MRIAPTFVCLAASLTIAGAPVAATPALAQSQTQNLSLDSAQRETIRVEMRKLLRSLSEILHGIALGNRPIVEKAARTSGNAAALASESRTRLPEHYVQLDLRIHQRLEQLANAAKTDENLVKRVAAIAAYCVTCHETYRVAEAPR